MLLAFMLLAAPVGAAELQPRTVAAFDRYVRVTEDRMARELDDERRFLLVDSSEEPRRRTALDRLRQGELIIERLQTQDAGKKIDVPGGMLHHWVGAVFVPEASVDEALALMQDYNRHATVFRPAVARSRLLSRDGDLYRVYLRFVMKKIITVVVNSEHEARFTRAGPARAYSRIYSTRIAEVEDADTPQEREKPVGRDGGYLWRLFTYWRFLERDGGTYIQCESISLTRGIPAGFGWLVGPFVTSIPRESLTFTLERARTTLARPRAAKSAGAGPRIEKPSAVVR
jgi:hypothetical protein